MADEELDLDALVHMNPVPFMGSFEMSVDGKGRFPIPTQLRQVMQQRSDDEAGKLYLSAAVRGGKYVACYDVLGFELQRLIDDSQPDKRLLVGAHVALVELDKQGRVLFPRTLAEHAGISPNSTILVAAAPNFTNIEVWNPERFREFYTQVSADHGKPNVTIVNANGTLYIAK
ncbi:hypothetical protein HY489_03795 [Candidatus Woesearchaeota archaeon]|nr:hypothetical protein [Candidatus Woesearchaeota archaeon]